MKASVITIALVLIAAIAYCQAQETIQPQVEGYQAGDTIRIDDFLKNGKLIVNSKDYRIVGFTLLVWAGFVQEFKSDSCTITNEMRKILEELKSKGFKTSKLYFHDIKIRNEKGEQRVACDIIYRLKLK